MAKRSVDVVIKAFDRASPAFRSAGASSQGLASRLFTLKNAAIAAVAGFVAHRLAGAVKSFMTHFTNLGDAFQKFSIATGMSTEMLSGLAHAASISGSSFERVKVGIKTFSTAAWEAQRGTKSYVDMFAELGVTVTDSGGKLKNVDRLLLESADAMKGLQNDTTRAALATRLFGRSGLELVPMLKEGSAGIGKLRQEAERLGVVWSQQDAERAAKFKDSMERFKQSLAGVGKAIFVRLAGPLTKLFNGLTEWFVRNRETIAAWALAAVKWLAKVGNVVWAVFESIGGAFNSLGLTSAPFINFLTKGLEGIAWLANNILLGVVGIVAAMEAVIAAGAALLSGEGLNAAIDNAIGRFVDRVQGYMKRDAAFEEMFKPGTFRRPSTQAAGAGETLPRAPRLRPRAPLPQPIGLVEGGRNLVGFAAQARDAARRQQDVQQAIRKATEQHTGLLERSAAATERAADALESFEGLGVEPI